MPERWLPVIGSEDSYQVSDKGRVCSLDRVILYADGRRQPLKGRVLQPTISGRNKKTGNGYRAVSIGKRGKVKVCVLMAEAFIGPRPFMGARLRHLNDNSLDDRLENLAWGTDSDNKRDLVRNGRHNMTRKTHCPANHMYSPENTFIGQGRRRCRICMRAQSADRKRKPHGRTEQEKCRLMTTDQQAPEFAAVLVQHAKGRAHDDATEKLRQAVEAVKRTGQSAKVTVELSIYPVKNNSSVIRMEDKVIAKIPEDPRSSMWYPDEKGNLYRNDPAQGSFFDADQTAADGKSAAAGRDN